MKYWKQLFLSLMLLNSAAAMGGTAVTLYKSPACSCCKKYVDYLRQNGFVVNAINQNDMDSIKKRYGVTQVSSCHTALINGYVVEGHVPVAAINKMLEEKPAIIGISVPGMPMNSPGMGKMEKGTLTVYSIPKGNAALKVFSVE